MGIFEAIILGILQGVTEFLPISSSAHIRIFGDLFGWGDPGAAFTAIIQIGTEAAVVSYFWRDIVRIISKWFRALPIGKWKNPVAQSDPDVRMGWIVIVGTLPIGILGLAFDDVIETSLRNLYITAFVLAVFAILLGVADRYSKRTKTLEHITLRDGLLLGLGQAMALIPGVSRSGGTITVGLLLGYTREAAARVAFLLAIPAVFASGIYQLAKHWGEDSVPFAPTAAATITAFVVGYAVIVWFLKLVSTKSYLPFVIYRLLLAAAVVGLLGAGLLSVY
ncbi:MAG: undecaprenyl-diphosphate phosphatase [Ancrocorticia sp.]